MKKMPFLAVVSLLVLLLLGISPAEAEKVFARMKKEKSAAA